MELYGYVDYYIRPGIHRRGNQSWACFCCCCSASYKRSRIDKRMSSKKKARRLAKREILFWSIYDC